MTVTWESHGRGVVWEELENLNFCVLGVTVFITCVMSLFTLCRSFGVLLWEIMTLGRSPYPGVENRELLEQIEEKGLKLSKPKKCPPEM